MPTTNASVVRTAQTAPTIVRFGVLRRAIIRSPRGGVNHLAE